jgi:hypothetical protein
MFVPGKYFPQYVMFCQGQNTLAYLSETLMVTIKNILALKMVKVFFFITDVLNKKASVFCPWQIC